MGRFSPAEVIGVLGIDAQGNEGQIKLVERDKRGQCSKSSTGSDCMCCGCVFWGAEFR
jgi:hypothetical protein